MARRNKTVAVIRCPTNLSMLAPIAEANGLMALATHAPNLFRLVHSGRNMASEIEPELLTATVMHLDRAAETGLIPSWHRVD